MVSNSSVLAYIAEHVNAVGYISSSYLNPEVKALAVEGADAFDKGDQRNDHPIKRPFYLYVDKNKFSGPVKSFILFIVLNKHMKSLFPEIGFYPSTAE